MEDEGWRMGDVWCYLKDANLAACGSLGRSRRRLCGTLLSHLIARSDWRKLLDHVYRCWRSRYRDLRMRDIRVQTRSNFRMGKYCADQYHLDRGCLVKAEHRRNSGCEVFST